MAGSKRVKDKRRLEKEERGKGKQRSGEKQWTSDFNHAIVAGTSWERAADSLHAVD